MEAHPFRFLSLAAIVSITIMETVALAKGIDGVLFATAMAMVAGLGGFSVGRITGGADGPPRP